MQEFEWVDPREAIVAARLALLVRHSRPSLLWGVAGSCLRQLHPVQRQDTFLARTSLSLVCSVEETEEDGMERVSVRPERGGSGTGAE